MLNQKEKEFIYWMEHSKGQEWLDHVAELEPYITEQRTHDLMRLYNVGVRVSKEMLDKE